jgi:hypothetical protein
MQFRRVSAFLIKFAIMKKLLPILLICISHYSNAQISLGSSDFESANDTFRVSIADPATLVDLVTTGANTTWDFSTLVPQSQNVDSFLSVANTGAIYSIYFINIAFNTNRANIARSGGQIPVIPGSPITLSDPFQFYYKNTSAYKQVGVGLTVSGIQTPIAFSSQDILYNFPVDFADQDSCNSAYSLSVPSVGDYFAEQKRVNNVDGWGTLITPFGTNSVLRVVTQLTGEDSIYVSTLGFGLSIPRGLTKEYKWLGVNQGIPLLQINTQVVGANEVVTAIRYRDNLPIISGIMNPSNFENTVITPNPSSSDAALVIDSKSSDNITVNVLNTIGQQVYSINKPIVIGKNKFDLSELNNLNEGVYTFQIQGNLGQETVRWVKTN